MIVSFLDEERYLPTFLASVAAQTRSPDLLLLVNDGSCDTSGDLAEAFAANHSYARVIHRPARPRERDRLATAAELKAFHWGLDQIGSENWDVVCKMDADLDLAPDHYETMLDAFDADPGLGVVGGFLASRGPDQALRRETHPPDHVRGPNKFYRRECLQMVEPLPEILGWDTFDERRAQMHGWRTASIPIPSGDSVHLRPTGTHDGRLRAFWRWGVCAWGCGFHPVYVVGGAVFRMRRRPYVVSGLAYLAGYLASAVRRAPRVEAETRAYSQSADRARLRNIAKSGGLLLRREHRPRAVESRPAQADAGD